MAVPRIAERSSVPQSLTEFAADRIREAVIDGTIGLGAKLSEKDLSEALGISKTPVREALLRLTAEGIIVVRPRIGTFVFTLELAEIERIGEYRRILESSAIELAIRRNAPALEVALHGAIAQMERHISQGRLKEYVADDATFHQCIFDLCGNSYLIDGYRSISAKVQAIRNRLSHDENVLKRSFSDHTSILLAVKSRSLDDAKSHTIRHAEIHEGVTQSVYDAYLKPLAV